MKNKIPWKCPRCNKMTTDYPSISRKDNKTEVCSRCGTNEALIGFYEAKKGSKLDESELEAINDMQDHIEALEKPENRAIIEKVTKEVKNDD